jgi:tRNA dimethylallyltransferase
MRLLAVVGPTASGKSRVGLALAGALRGEIISCDSTAVYRGLDIGTDKLPPDARRGVMHHLVDVADPGEVYSAARYAREASAAAKDITSRSRLPVLVGGTGFYYRAFVRGLFPGPARDEALRRRLERVAERRGVEALHRWLRRVDHDSALRIQPRDRKRLIRALEVYLLTGRALTAHFEDTRPPIPNLDVCTIGLDVSRAELAVRVARRVDEQFERGVVDEVRRLLAAGVPASSQALGGLVYRQVREMIQGVRSEPDTRALIVRENLRYARRQRIWFRKEPGVRWLDATDSADAEARALEHARDFLESSAPSQPIIPSTSVSASHDG